MNKMRSFWVLFDGGAQGGTRRRRWEERVPGGTGDSIGEDVTKVEVFLAAHNEEYAAVAAKGLCKWVRAMDMYHMAPFISLYKKI